MEIECYCEKNKKAWEYNAYDFCVSNAGKPAERAKRDLENPKGSCFNYFQIISFEKVETGIKNVKNTRTIIYIAE